MDARAIASSDADKKWAKGAWMRALERTAPNARNPVLTLPMLIDDLGERFGAAHRRFRNPKLSSTRETRGRVCALGARPRRHLRRSGLRVFVPNCADYLA